MQPSRRFPAPDLDNLDVGPNEKRRVLMTVSCHDCDVIPKVENAGQYLDRDGRELQIMHNGLLIDRGCYYGPWTDEIIRATGGHHEPQEELVFYRIMEALRASGDSKLTSVEFGSFWAYYSMWFAHDFPGSRSIALEPDPAYLEVGKKNAALNGLQDAITFGQGAVGAEPGKILSFQAESDRQSYDVMQYDLASTMDAFDLDHVDLLLVDIQGFEQVLLPRAVEQFTTGKVRFVIVSTHHHIYSGHPTTHQDMVKLLKDAGAHIIVEHSVSESFSGDGLIAASFDPRDVDLSVSISFNRAVDSLFGGLEPALADALALVDQRWADLERTQRALEATQAHVADLTAELEPLRRRLARLRGTFVWRYGRRAVSVARRVRSRVRRSTAPRG